MPTTAFPNGTITFLFSDIEGSTRLWEAHPDAMRLAVARHDFLLRQAVQENNGYLFKTTGDGIAAAFAVAAHGVATALAAQRALTAEPWAEQVVIRARMGLHTGAAELRDGDYFGTTLSRTARLMSAGHGGQTLLSDATHELCRDTLPESVSLLPLGEYRLKDLTRSETVYQMAHPALVADFPALRTLDNPAFPNNLPQQLTSFVGREKALSEVADLLDKTRLLTLTGSGGSGKTRLSLQVAADALERYPDGTWQVELAPLSNPTLVPQTVALALGVKEQAGQTLAQTLTDYLKPRRLLLVLDNCEHLLGSCATLVAVLLRACPQVKVLATSREPLCIAGETTYRVASLTLPSTAQAKAATPANLSQFEAVRLFIERARAVKPDFAVTNANAPSLAQLCHRLDGIPLALELAAARVRSLPVEQINDKLDSCFRLLTGGDRSALPRQQTLRALIDWSYDLLNPGEKTLLARLSIFEGGWVLAAAESVCGFAPLEDWEVLDLLSALVDKSLVVYEEGKNGEAPRYRLLETIMHYSEERLKENGGEKEARQRHLDFFLALAEEAEPQLHQHGSMKRLQVEADNLRAALTQSHSDTQVALRLAGALVWYWCFTDSFCEGLAHISVALSLPGAQERTAARAKVLIGAAFLSEGDTESYVKEGLSIARELGEKHLIVWALMRMGSKATNHDSYETAHEMLTESLALCQSLGYWSGTLWALNHLGKNAMEQNRAAEAREYWERAVTLAREGNFDSQLCWTLNSLAKLNRDESRQETALALAKESWALVRAEERKWDFWWTAEIVANLHLDAGEFEEARRVLGEVEAFGEAEGWKKWIKSQVMMVRSCLGLGQFDSAHSFLEGSLSIEGADEDGWIQQYQGDVALGGQDKNKARPFYQNSLRLFWEQQDMAGVFLALSGLSATEEAERSVCLHGAAQALCQREEAVRRVLTAHGRQQQMYENVVAAYRAALGDASFAVAYGTGATMTLESTVKYALEADG
ncbi:MAG: adenylate/guanylate cyclase domain-containing protein [Armatimonadetes bacterium]|nr:adenylate/guanylate cyclase domain-containing protein [Armatimonadota bacterium]